MLNTNSIAHQPEDEASIPENHFTKFTSLCYQVNEVYDIRRLYNNDNHPISEAVIRLLLALDSFFHATTLENEFIIMRNKNLSDKTRREKLNKISTALTTISTLAKKYNGKKAEILNSALQYGVHCIELRLVELEKIQDRYYAIYQETNFLKKYTAEYNSRLSIAVNRAM